MNASDWPQVNSPSAERHAFFNLPKTRFVGSGHDQQASAALLSRSVSSQSLLPHARMLVRAAHTATAVQGEWQTSGRHQWRAAFCSLQIDKKTNFECSAKVLCRLGCEFALTCAYPLCQVFWNRYFATGYISTAYLSCLRSLADCAGDKRPKLLKRKL